jgi:hypothetical protein
MADRGAWRPSMHNFVHGCNIAKFTNLLATERDSTKRPILMKLLVEEEDRFGYGREQLAVAERHLVQCQGHITKLRALIDSLHRNGENTRQENELLDAMSNLQTKFQAYRDMIRDRVQ